LIVRSSEGFGATAETTAADCDSTRACGVSAETAADCCCAADASA
jgi:hypothetical protein